MITKMKKLTFLVYHKEYEEFLNSLRELGVVHIVEKQQGAADNTELQENIRLSNRLAATTFPMMFRIMLQPILNPVFVSWKAHLPSFRLLQHFPTARLRLSLRKKL